MQFDKMHLSKNKKGNFLSPEKISSSKIALEKRRNAYGKYNIIVNENSKANIEFCKKYYPKVDNLIKTSGGKHEYWCYKKSNTVKQLKSEINYKKILENLSNKEKTLDKPGQFYKLSGINLQKFKSDKTFKTINENLNEKANTNKKEETFESQFFRLYIKPHKDFLYTGKTPSKIENSHKYYSFTKPVTNIIQTQPLLIKSSEKQNPRNVKKEFISHFSVKKINPQFDDCNK